MKIKSIDGLSEMFGEKKDSELLCAQVRLASASASGFICFSLFR